MRHRVHGLGRAGGVDRPDRAGRSVAPGRAPARRGAGPTRCCPGCADAARSAAAPSAASRAADAAPGSATARPPNPLVSPHQHGATGPKHLPLAEMANTAGRPAWSPELAAWEGRGAPPGHARAGRRERASAWPALGRLPVDAAAPEIGRSHPPGVRRSMGGWRPYRAGQPFRFAGQRFSGRVKACT